MRINAIFGLFANVGTAALKRLLWGSSVVGGRKVGPLHRFPDLLMVLVYESAEV